jgi:hypothetical protein
VGGFTRAVTGGPALLITLALVVVVAYGVAVLTGGVHGYGGLAGHGGHQGHAGATAMGDCRRCWAWAECRSRWRTHC